MNKRFRVCSHDQPFLLPPSLQDWLPENHLSRFVADVMNELDLSSIYGSYERSDGRGLSAYHPMLMARLLLYGYCIGITSSRKIEQATYDNVAFRYLSADQHPDHDTLAAFRQEHVKALGELFLQALRLCQKAGLVKLGNVSIDGTKIKANASPRRSVKYDRISQREQHWRAEVARLLQQAQQTDREEERRLGLDQVANQLPDELANSTNQTTLAEGTIAELHEWSAINDQDQRKAIINAVTNCITIGDVTAIDALGNVELIEVKSGKTKDRRLIRQKNRLKSAAGFLTSGVGTINGKQVSAGSFPLTPRSRLLEVGTKLDEAGKSGWSAGLVAPHCYLDCFDMRTLASVEGLDAAVRDAHKKLDEQWGEDLITTWNSLDVIAFTPNVAPFSIFPFDDRICIELMLGAKFFINSLNLSEVLRTFVRAGWSIKAFLDEALSKTNGEAVVVMSKGDFLCYIPPGDFAKLQYEFLDPASLLEEFECLRSYGASAVGAYSAWTYEGEAAQWN